MIGWIAPALYTPSLLGGRPDEPALASATNKNWPLPRRNTWRPCASNSGVGVGVKRQLNSQQPAQPFCSTGPTKRGIGPVCAVAIPAPHTSSAATRTSVVFFTVFDLTRPVTASPRSLSLQQEETPEILLLLHLISARGVARNSHARSW